MIADCIYIDTRPGQNSIFSPPEPVEDYPAWLMAQYKRSLGSVDGLSCGVAQKINAMAYQHKSDQFSIDVRAHGPYAGHAAAVIDELTQGVIVVEVLG